MPDIAITWNPATQTGDWTITGGEVATGGDLLTAVLVSLFTDKVLPDDQPSPDGSNDPRGWWADIYTEDPIGSLLWTLSRATITNSTELLGAAQKMCLDALNWMIGDGVASAIQVNTQWLAAGQMGISIVIAEPSGQNTTFNLSMPMGAS